MATNNRSSRYQKKIRRTMRQLSPFTQEPNGQVSWSPQPGDYYLVTGTTRSGKRFRFQTDKWPLAAAINVWHGTKWLVRDGQRFSIQRIYN
jgi:hypothetical protein